MTSATGAPAERGALAHLARFVLRHRKAVIAFWLAFLVAGFALGRRPSGIRGTPDTHKRKGKR